MRRPSIATTVLFLVLLPLGINLFTNAVKIPNQWQPGILILTIGISVVAVAITVRGPDAGERTRPDDGEIDIDEVANQLALTVGTQWRREEERQRIHDPLPLSLRWRNAQESLVDHWANIRRASVGISPDPLDLAGRLDQIMEIYRGIPSGRLLILGQAGSGKSILALRLVRDLLNIRTATDPVPVIFSLGSWDPVAISLRGWLTVQLIRDYPGLTALSPSGVNLATTLVGADRILPILDGFDEIADGLQRAALEALNGISLPLLLTSRVAEYTEAVAGADVLTSAAGIELTDLTLTDLVNYLPRTTRKSPSNSATVETAWDPVLNELRDHPQRLASQNLASVLRTPLMVALARTAYSDTPDGDPSDLLDTDRFATSRTIEDHLLSKFIATVYRTSHGNPSAAANWRWNPDRAQSWLSYLAHHLNRLSTRDLAWWELGSTMRYPFRMLIVGLVIGLPFGILDGLIVGFVGELITGFVGGLANGMVNGLMAGLASGSAHGFMARFGSSAFQPSRVQIKIRGGAGRTGNRESFLHRFRVGLVIGIVGGFLLELVVEIANTLLGELVIGVDGGFTSWVALALVFGVGGGLGYGLTAWLEAPIEIRSAASPSDLLKTNRTTVLVQCLVFGLVFGLGVGLVGGLWGGLGLVGGLAWGFVGGFGGGLGLVLSVTAWGQWVVFSRVWLPLTGRFPWAVLAFLDDACQRGVLRQAGAVYQFRHARLQDYLAGEARSD